MKIVKTLFVITILLCFSAAHATYTFDVLTSNTPDGASVGSQLSMDVYAVGSDVAFHFANVGLIDSVVSEIYFDDGSLLAYSSIDESLSGVDFKEDDVGGVNPPNLPAGNLAVPPFVATACFSMEPSNPAPKNGIGLGEWLTIIYSLQSSQTIQDVLDELANGDLRVGLHVIAIPLAGGGTSSESYMNIPEPMTIALLGLGGLLLRKKK